jgi:hypothetical protein
MKYLKLTDIFSRIMIAAGIVIFGVIIYQIIFDTFNQSDSPRPRPRPAPARPRIRPRPVESSAALKETANYLREIETQKVPGFSEIETFSHSGHYDSWDGKVQSWWEYSDQGDQKVIWRSAPCPEKETTTLVFSGVLGTAAGEARLYVNDQTALTFNTGFGPETEDWKEGDYRLKFFSIVVKDNQERLGIFCLTVPEKDVTPGKPVTLAVRAEAFHKSGAGNSFFMLSSIPDSLQNLLNH